MKLSHIISIIFVIFLAFLSINGSRNFDKLEPGDQAENLRWLSSALIQAYASILALVPAISLALMSFFTSGYRSRLVKMLWESLEMHIFFIAIFACIIYCHIVLITVPGTSSSMGSYLRYSLYIEIATIFVVILVLYLLLDRIWKVVDADIMGEAFKNLKKEILDSDGAEEKFEDFFSAMASVAENRDLTSMRIGLETLFDLVIESGKYHEKVDKILEDIKRHYQNSREYFCLDAVNRMIERGYAKIEENSNLEPL